MNKKIRYAIGAVGAMPLLAMTPGQFAAPAAHAGITAATTGKKVRTVYATDTAVFATASSRSSTSPAISPNVGSCTGTTGHHTKQGDVTVRFYTRAVGADRTCVGTIKVSDTSLFNSFVRGHVQNLNGSHFCTFVGNGSVATHVCRRVFENTTGTLAKSLTVVGAGVDIFSNVTSAKSKYPFRNNGF